MLEKLLFIYFILNEFSKYILFLIFLNFYLFSDFFSFLIMFFFKVSIGVGRIGRMNLADFPQEKLILLHKNRLMKVLNSKNFSDKIRQLLEI